MSALASDIQLLAHVRTQAPYCLVMIVFSIIFGTIPIGFQKMPNIVGFLLGWGVTVAFVYGICKPVISPTGAWDVFNWIFMKLSPDPRLEELAEDVVRVALHQEDVSGEYMSKNWEIPEDTGTAFTPGGPDPDFSDTGVKKLNKEDAFESDDMEEVYLEQPVQKAAVVDTTERFDPTDRSIEKEDADKESGEFDC